MINLPNISILQRLAVMAGLFLMWSVAFFVLVENARTYAEILVLIPVIASAALLGVRGGLAGSMVGVLGITIFHLIDADDPFQLLQGWSPVGVGVMVTVAAVVGYGRVLETRRAAASQLLVSAHVRLDRLETESRLLSRLSTELGRTTSLETIGSSVNLALAGIVAFDCMALYLLDAARAMAKICYITDTGRNDPAVNDEFSLEEILRMDPFDCPQPAGELADSVGGRRSQPPLILQWRIDDGAESLALLRLWSVADRSLSWCDKKYIRSVVAQITSALTRVRLQSEIERDSGVSAVVAEFVDVTYKSLDVAAVVGAASRHIGRYLKTENVALAVTDLDGRRVSIGHGDGFGWGGLEIRRNRTVKEALADPLADYQTKVVSTGECEAMGRDSEIARALAKTGLGSFIVLNLQHDGELVAQLWIGLEMGRAVSPDQIEYITRVGHHLVVALTNAEKSERTRELQRQFVGQNEQFAYVQDVLERAEAELQASNQQLTELSESKTEFMAAVAHEMKIPLSVIIGYADLLRFDLEKIDAEQREFAGHIERSARLLLALADEFGDVSKIDSGRFSVVKNPHDISAVLSSVVEDLNISTTTSHGRIQYTVPSAQQMYDGDSVRLAQVFTNLITNALKYSSNDKPVEITLTSAPDRLVITVTDYGLGISRADQDNLFVPFFRSTNPEALRRPGTGLGLVVAKSIIEEHGGKLSVWSDLGSSSIFTIALPLGVPESQTRSA